MKQIIHHFNSTFYSSPDGDITWLQMDIAIAIVAAVLITGIYFSTKKAKSNENSPA